VSDQIARRGDGRRQRCGGSEVGQQAAPDTVFGDRIGLGLVVGPCVDPKSFSLRSP
jgi:hypothetical protein